MIKDTLSEEKQPPRCAAAAEGYIFWFRNQIQVFHQNFHSPPPRMILVESLDLVSSSTLAVSFNWSSSLLRAAAVAARTPVFVLLST